MVRAVLQRLAQWWDRFATVEVPTYAASMAEIIASTEHRHHPARWHERAKLLPTSRSGGTEGFQTPKAFAQVSKPAAQKQDYRAAMPHSELARPRRSCRSRRKILLHALAIRWMWN